MRRQWWRRAAEDYAAQAEGDRPLLSQLHLSQYQTRFHPIDDAGDFHGMATDGEGPTTINIDIDEEENVATHWKGPVVKHIDHNEFVHQNIIRYLQNLR